MKSEFRADLHIHSACSDGTDSPQKILELALAKGLQGLSITDHDTLHAYTPMLMQMAKEMNIALLPGAEVSSEWNETTVHILAYAFNDSLRELIDQVAHFREQRNEKILEKLQKKGMRIGREDLVFSEETKSIGRTHIALAMVKKGYVSTTKEAYLLYLKDGACCYASGQKYSPIEVIDKIHAAKGLAVLAHPHLYREDRILSELLSFPFDGLECYYGALSNVFEQHWLQIAKEKNWIPTGGSDYHGSIRSSIMMGSSYVNESIFQKLYSHYAHN